MRQILIFLLSVCSLFAAAQPSISDTTKFSVFDRTNAWVTTGALLKAYCASGGGSGDLVNGGQSTGATVSYGTTDAQAAAIKTNSVERISITGGASTGGATTITDVTANTNTVENALTVRTNSTGTAAAGFGVKQLFMLESSTSNNQNAASIDVAWSTATHASRTADIIFSTVASAGALAEGLRLGGTDYSLTATASVANTNTLNSRLKIITNSSGSASAGFGGQILFQGETSTTNSQDMGSIGFNWLSATHASRTSNFIIKTVNAGSPQEVARFNPYGALLLANPVGTPGTTTYADYAIDAGVAFSLSSSAGANITIASSGNDVANVKLNATANQTTASGTIGNTVFTTTSGTKYDWRFTGGYTASSGTGGFFNILANGTINQTLSTGACGFIDISPTLTNISGGYSGIRSTTSNSSMKFLDQTGANTTNILVGKTTFGSTTAPTARVMIAAGTTAATTAPLKFTSGPVMTTPEAGAVEFLTDAAYLTTTTGTVRRMLVGSQCARATAQTAANSSVATFTTPAVDGTYEVSGHITVTTSSAEAFSLTVDYTDESNTARTATIPLLRISTGAFTGTTISASGAVTYPSATIPIRCKASTAITLKTAGTFTGCTYNVEGCIKQIN